VFRSNEAMELREATATVIKDALLTARYDAKICSIHADARATQLVYKRQMKEAAMQRELDTLLGDVGKMMYVAPPPPSTHTTTTTTPSLNPLMC
jgi:hypothetical protein